MPLTHAGTPVWTDDQGLRFENVAYPELDAAHGAWQTAMDNWHHAVGGNPATNTPPHPDLVRIHDNIKLRTNDPTLAEPREPFWNAQATVIGIAGMPHSDPALIEELKRAYATHAGPETEALVGASKTLHEHRLNLSREQLGIIRNATELSGLDSESLHAGKDIIIRGMEHEVIDTQRALAHSEQYLREMPTLRRESAAAGNFISRTWRGFRNMHGGAQTAIIGGTAAAVAGIGYWALRSKEKPEQKQPGTEIPGRQ